MAASSSSFSTFASLGLSALVLSNLCLTAWSAPVPMRWSRMVKNPNNTARKMMKREVPQEHSHEPILDALRTVVTANNPNNLPDVVFGLLGNAAASKAAPDVDPECLQQELADQGFTNAKANSDIDGMVAALQYRALERNTGSVGLQSNQCVSVKAQNPEIAAIQQHQDPASDGAAATNKAIVLELAKQINTIGGDPQLALATGTFAPGQKDDATAKGNTCDVEGDAKGCIVSQNLLVEDATADEIDAAVSGAGNNANFGSAGDKASSSSDSSSKTSQSSNANVDAVSSTSSTSSVSAGEFGSCITPQIEGGVGFDGRKEFSFQPVDKANYPHSSAQNIGIITQFMCDTLVNNCGLKANDPGHTLCQQAQDAVGQGKDNGSLADQFNAFFGEKTAFANSQGSTSASTSTSSTSSSSSNASSSQNQNGSANDATTNDSNAAGSTSSSSTSSSTSTSTSQNGAGGSSNLDLGSCSDPTIIFANNLDGRDQPAFQPNDLQQFNHGSALNIGVISDFICGQLQSACKASQDAINACDQAKSDATAATQTDGSAADAFNKALGFQTDFASGAASGAGVATTGNDGASQASAAGDNNNNSASGNANSASNSNSKENVNDNSESTSSSSSSSSSSTTSATTTDSSQNLQTFTGNKGGLPPEVTTSAKGFQTNGSEFVNLNAAIGRSCDVQHNSCANLANSNGNFSVQDCDQQDTQCKATTN